MYVRWDYEEIAPADVGTKGYYLSKLKRLGLRIPAGFILTTTAFLDFIIANGIYDRLTGIVANLQPEEIKESIRRNKIGELFAKSNIPTQIMDELTSAGNILSVKTLAVRSSAIIEDLPKASFAGLYDTFLNVTVGNELIESVKRCWQSAFGLRALTYCQRLDLQIKDLKDIAIAVIVQEMINARFAGVMFTVHPGTGDASKILIEYSAGLGNLVVSGERTPETILIDKVTNRIDKKGQDLLDERYVFQLASIGKKIEEAFGCYQDIEWAIDNGSAEIIILQARPETVWNRRHQMPFHKPGQTVFSFIPEVKFL